MTVFIKFLPLIILLLCFIFRAPIGFSMIGAGVVYLLIMGKDVGLSIDVITSGIYCNSVIIAIPLFIFTANIMNSGKVTEYMFTFVKALVGKKKGAMAYINIIVSLIFSGMSGAALADVSGIGTLEIAEMKKDGYDMPFSCAITATTSVVGPIFPPSIPMVIYGLIAEVSVGKLFMGGMIPAFLICIVLGVYVWYISRKRNYPVGEKFTPKQFVKYTFRAAPALITPVILLGGIYGGVVTPTEAGALAAFYTIIISVLVYRVLGIKDFIKAITDTIIQTGIIIAIVAGAYVMSYVITSSGLANIITAWFLNITDNKYIFLVIINIVFLILGMFLDAGVMQFVFLPLVLPVVRALGINLIHFGVVITVNMMIGACTPPYGILCYVVSGMTETPLQKVFRETIPMSLMQIIVLIMITYIPSLVMFIPNAMIS